MAEQALDYVVNYNFVNNQTTLNDWRNLNVSAEVKQYIEQTSLDDFKSYRAKVVEKISHEIQPRQMCVVWEGGGSSRRKALYSDYKQQRRPEKLNRFYEDDIPDSDDNRQHQLITLIGLVKNLPIRQLYVSDCEGDDVIAYLCNGPFKQKNKDRKSTRLNSSHRT